MEWKWMEKLPKRNQLIIWLIVGVLLVIIAIPIPEKKQEEKEEKEKKEQITENKEQYEVYTEQRLKHILEKIEGAGTVEVMITFQGSSEKIVEKDGETSIYEEQSDGAQNPYVRQELLPEVEGVVVVAQGGGNAIVVKHITEAVQALFSIDTHKIKVTKGG